jgi:putative methionine-R-sulfoxide reductase with GAF domain/streptogramin lyase
MQSEHWKTGRIWPVILAMVVGGALRVSAQAPVFRTFPITEVSGEPLTSVVSLLEDERGFLWLGGFYGFFRYDGADLELFASDPSDPGSITYSAISHLIKSREGGFWLGTMLGGINYFDPATQKAVSYLHDPEDPGSLSNDRIYGLFEDREGGLWVGAGDFTLNYLPRGGDKFIVYQAVPPERKTIQEIDIGGLGEIIQDTYDDNRLWIGSKFGLYSFDKTSKEFTLHPFDSTVQFWYRPYGIQLHMTPDGAIWVGSFETGLLRFDVKTREWKAWNHPKSNVAPIWNTIAELMPYEENWLVGLTFAGELWWMDWQRQEMVIQTTWISEEHTPRGASCMITSANGGFWIGFASGLVRVTSKPAIFPYIPFANHNPGLNKNNWQRASVLSPDRQTMYIGTFRGDGLIEWHWPSNRFNFVRYKSGPDPSQADVWMDALCFDNQGVLWVGTDEGLLYLEPGSSRLRPVTDRFPGADSLMLLHSPAVQSVDDALWIGTSRHGLFRLGLHDGKIQQIAPEQLSNAAITKIARNSNGKVWVGSDRGLWAISPSGRVQTRFGKDRREGAGLSHEHITDFEWDNQGDMWISTLGGGLNRLHFADGSRPVFQYYLNNDALGGNVIYELEVHPNGQIWMGTESGLAWLDPANSTFTNYDYRDGLYPKYGSLQLLPNGYFASGANRGMDYFHPDTLLRNEIVPVPYLKRFRIFDDEVPLREKMALSYRQNHFSFEMGALNYNINAVNTFTYQLEGYDAQWISSGKRNFVSYTNLPAGRYRFKFKAANRHNTRSDRTYEMEIILRPPFWQTWWFRLLAVAAAAGVIAVGLNFRRNKRREKIAAKAIDYFANSTYPLASVDEILWDVARNCISRLDLEDCIIYLVDGEKQTLVQKAAYGPKSPGFNEILEPIEIPIGHGIVGSVALNRLPEIIRDTALDPRYIPDDKFRKSEITVPIIHEGKVIGVIDSEHSRKGFFTGFHLKVLMTIAGLCSDKIAKAMAEQAIREKEKLLSEMDRHLAETQLIALRAQMNPHFLFNCLNSINWYIIKNKPREASRYLTRFSRLIRLILDHSKATQISLEQELEALRLYIDMEAMRFENKFEYTIEVDERIDQEEVSIPPLILQPYVENAIWHGLMQNLKPGVLRIALFPENGNLKCLIEDNGIGRKAAEGIRAQSMVNRESQGMAITEKRISMLHLQQNPDTLVEIEDLYDEAGMPAGTRVILKLPLT